MITELTPEQIAKFPIYVEKWINKGLTTKQKTLEDATIDFTNFQKIIQLKQNPSPIVLFQSPEKCWNEVLKYPKNTKNQVWNQVSNQVWNQVGNQVRNQVSNQVRNQVRNQVWNQVWNQVSNQVSLQIKNLVYPYFDCQFWANWFAFYEFMNIELNVKFSNQIQFDTFKKCQEYGMVFPLDEICIVCQPPTIIKTNELGQLHCETGPALSYNGDNEIYALNGVVMQKEHVITLAENPK